MNYRRPITGNPIIARSGEPICAIDKRWFERHDERALIIQFICDRRLFGDAYRRLQGDYFWNMPPESGVLVAPLRVTAEIFPGEIRPGDIDILLLPYEGDEIVLDRAMALEVKVVRASFDDQGKSPNQFGFTQAESLLRLGFPYVGVVHLIVADQSPPLEWRQMMQAKVMEDDKVGDFQDIVVDTLPSKLIERCFGRLLARRTNDQIGLISAFVGDIDDPKRGMWCPQGQEARLNSNLRQEALDRLAAYLHKNTHLFLATPRHDSDRWAKGG